MALATIQRLFCSKDEMGTKGFLGVKTDTSCDEERIELLDALEVVFAEGMDGIVVEVKRLLFFTWLDNPNLSFIA